MRRVRVRRGRADGPPRLAEALLLRLLPAELAEPIAGDLGEAHERMARERGRLVAAAWYWMRVVTFRYVALRRSARRAYGAGERRRFPGGGLLQDLRFAVRALRKQGAVSVLAIGTLALGIGATTVVYGVVDGVLLRPLPYPRSERLVDVWSTYQPWEESENPLLRAFASSFPISFDTYEAWRARAAPFEALGVYRPEPVTVSGGERPERVEAVHATAGVFDALGTRPVLGRGIVAADERAGAPPVAVLSFAYWQRRFGGERSAIGRTVRTEDGSYTIVGVMPRGFYFPDPDYEIWLTFTDGLRARAREAQMLQTIAVLRPGVTFKSAELDLASVQPASPDTRPEEWGVRIASRLEEVVGDSRAVLLILLGAAGLVLAIASANVVNLLLVRATARRHELVVRAALGADRRRLLQALMGESLVLALLGGAAGAALAAVALPVVVRFLPATLPRTVEIRPDARMFLFAAGVTLIAAIAAGAGPAWAGARQGIAGVLRDEARGSIASRGGGRTRSILVVAEVALAFLLLAGTGLLGRSLLRLNAQHPGFQREGLIVAQLHLPASRYADAAASLSFGARVRERLGALPGVTAVGIAEDVPFAGGNSAGSIAIEGGGDGAPVEASVGQAVVSDGYVEAMGIAVVEGRAFRATDRAGSEPVTVISRAMARRYWPDASPIGARIRDGGKDSDEPWRTVVGVVDDVRHAALGEDPAPKMYVPLAQDDDALRDPDLVVRTAGDPGAALAAVAPALLELDPEVAVARVARMHDLVAQSTAVHRFRTLLIGGLACLAGALALAGLYGVLSFVVACSTAEIGVRVALGARPARIVRDVLARGLGLAAAGIGLGLMAGLFVFRLLDGFLFDVAPTDPATLGAIALLLLATTAAAAWIPGRRAARIDPLEALRRSS